MAGAKARSLSKRQAAPDVAWVRIVGATFAAQGPWRGAYAESMTAHSLMAIRSGRCPSLLDSAAAGLASSIRQPATTTRKITGLTKISGEHTTGDITTSVEVTAEWPCTPRLIPPIATLRLASMVSTPLMKRSSILTVCADVGAGGRTRQRGVDR